MGISKEQAKAGASAVVTGVMPGPAGTLTGLLDPQFGKDMYSAVGGIRKHRRDLEQLDYMLDETIGPLSDRPSPTNSACPLILDLNKNGIVDTTDIADGVHFDHDGNRFAEKTSWVGAGDALLVRDINGNGLIDDGGELFGNNTLFGNGQNAANGFQSLAGLDSNGDGVIDSYDEAWSELRLWSDLNSNGGADDGEWLTLEEAGIARLNLGYTNSNYIDANGNQHRQIGSFNWADGTAGQMADVWFQSDLTDSHYLDEIDVSIDIKKLPNLRGYGNIPSLHQAMTADKGGRLQTLMEQFVNSESLSAKDLVMDIIFAWTGVSDLDVDSRGVNIGDARKLYALEKMWGEGFSSPGFAPNIRDSATLNQIFSDLEKRLTSYLMLSTHYDIFNLFAIDASASLEDGVEPKKALWPIYTLMQSIYSYGTEYEIAEMSDFLTLLRASDFSYGYACLDVLQQNVLDLEMECYNKDYNNHDLNRLILKDSHLLLSGTNTNDSLTAGNEGAWLDGGAGDDALYGRAGNDLLRGEAGNDKLYGGAGNDILDGGAGNDYLEGGAGDDVYVFGRGYGHDTVVADDLTPDKHDSIFLTGLTLNEVEFITKYFGETSMTGYGRHVYSHLVIRIKDTGETLTVDKGVWNTATGINPFGVQSIQFGDGTVMSWDEMEKSGLMKMEGTVGNDTLYASRLDTTMHGGDGDDKLTGGTGNDKLYGGAGKDFLYGGAGDDILDGGAGNDYLEGGAGNDTYVFGRGYGHDTVNADDLTPNKHDSIFLTGLTLNEVEFITKYFGETSMTGYGRHVYSHLVIRIKDTGETLTVDKGVWNTATGINPFGVQSIQFGDGTVMSWDEMEKSGLMKMEGTVGNDTLYASRLDTTMHGGDGDDKLTGGTGNDKLYGGAGKDFLYGGAGDDILDGGAGNDYLDGGAGNDTYVFRSGGGQDTINNYGGGDDLLKFENINPVDLWFGRSGNNLTIGLVGSTDKVTVDNWYGGDYKIDTIQAGNDIITETQVAQLVQAMASIGAPGGIGGGWTENQKDALAPVLTTYWKTAA